MSTLKVTNIQHGSATNVAMVLDTAGTVKAYSTISVGNVTPSSSGAGITFPATQSASSDANTLDDYEEGTWTPTLTGSTTAGNQTYASNTYGTYTKIGRLVTLNFVVTLSNKGTIAGNVDLTGLPFNLSSTNFANRYPVGSCGWGSLATNWVNVTIGSNGATASLRFGGAKTAGTGGIDMDAADLGNSSVLSGSIQYCV